MQINCIGRKSLHESSTWIYANIFRKREKILSSSIYSAMSETVLVLDSKTAVRRSSSEFTVELRPLLPLDKYVDYKLALISSEM